MSIGVLVVDDSALIRSLLKEIINQQKDMHVVGAAQDAFVAKDMVNKFNPDVITLDIEMPKVDGLMFLDRLMKARPTPVLMISTLTEQGADATLRALELGAIDYIAKPKLAVAEGIAAYEQEITNKIRLASQANVRRYRASPVASIGKHSGIVSTENIIAIGASTGGCEAIKEVLEALPSNCPAVVITQHMPAGFTTSFAKRLNNSCQMRVKEAEEGERILPGTAYIAPGSMHFKIVRSGTDYRVKLDNGERVSGHKPSVDVMFDSLNNCNGKNVVAAILTGMGKDGAQSMLKLKQSGAHTIAQSEASCVVYGMPKEAVKLNATEQQLDLELIAEQLLIRATRNQVSTRL